MIHINLNTTFYTHVEHSPTKTIYIKYYMETHMHARTRTHAHANTHTHTPVAYQDNQGNETEGKVFKEDLKELIEVEWRTETES